MNAVSTRSMLRLEGGSNESDYSIFVLDQGAQRYVLWQGTRANPVQEFRN